MENLEQLNSQLSIHISNCSKAKKKKELAEAGLFIFGGFTAISVLGSGLSQYSFITLIISVILYFVRTNSSLAWTYYSKQYAEVQDKRDKVRGYKSWVDENGDYWEQKIS